MLKGDAGGLRCVGGNVGNNVGNNGAWESRFVTRDTLACCVSFQTVCCSVFAPPRPHNPLYTRRSHHSLQAARLQGTPGAMVPPKAGSRLSRPGQAKIVKGGQVRLGLEGHEAHQHHHLLPPRVACHTRFELARDTRSRVVRGGAGQPSRARQATNLATATRVLPAAPAAERQQGPTG